MDFDQLVVGAFGTDDLSAVAPDRLISGIVALRAQFDTLGGGEERLAIWCLLHMLRAAPDPDDAFRDEADREAAYEFADSLDEDGDA